MINGQLSEMAIEWMRGDEFDLCFLREMRERTSDVRAKKYFNNQTSLNEYIWNEIDFQWIYFRKRKAFKNANIVLSWEVPFTKYRIKNPNDNLSILKIESPTTKGRVDCLKKRLWGDTHYLLKLDTAAVNGTEWERLVNFVTCLFISSIYISAFYQQHLYLSA